MDEAEATPVGPRGFRVHTAPAGLAVDGRDDLTVIATADPAVSSVLLTRSRFAGPSVVLSRAAATRGTARAVVALARNANVATGPKGLADATEIRERIAGAMGVHPDDVVIASTGVIGVPYPMESVRAALDRVRWPFTGTDLTAAASAIMTTDTCPKFVRATCGPATLVGVAKGVGMMEPDMATLLAFFFTDAELAGEELDGMFRRVVDRTFNALSIDTDTSTSDTAAILANGRAGPVDPAQFEAVLHDAALQLVTMLARDGEGASKLIEVRVTGARGASQARRVGKAVVNSPLVKTAVHGADPNWGRVAMAVGKCQEDTDIDPERVRIGFGGADVYPTPPDAARLAALAEHLKGEHVLVEVDLGVGDEGFTVYGCDLTEEYVRLNSSYTT